MMTKNGLTTAALRGIGVTLNTKGGNGPPETLSLGISTNVIDDWFIIFYIVHYIRKTMPQKFSISYIFCVIVFQRGTLYD